MLCSSHVRKTFLISVSESSNKVWLPAKRAKGQTTAATMGPPRFLLQNRAWIVLSMGSHQKRTVWVLVQPRELDGMADHYQTASVWQFCWRIHPAHQTLLFDSSVHQSADDFWDLNCEGPVGLLGVIVWKILLVTNFVSTRRHVSALVLWGHNLNRLLHPRLFAHFKAGKS